MKQLIHEFYAEEKDPLTTFRTILLFGKNVIVYQKYQRFKIKPKLFFISIFSKLL